MFKYVGRRHLVYFYELEIDINKIMNKNYTELDQVVSKIGLIKQISVEFTMYDIGIMSWSGL